ncbi:Protein of unknown function [Gryllus bimaculatus]|nr:Protein of unknown function [Gryllus bimaculatus]
MPPTPRANDLPHRKLSRSAEMVAGRSAAPAPQQKRVNGIIPKKCRKRPAFQVSRHGAFPPANYFCYLSAAHIQKGKKGGESGKEGTVGREKLSNDPRHRERGRCVIAVRPTNSAYLARLVSVRGPSATPAGAERGAERKEGATRDRDGSHMMAQNAAAVYTYRQPVSCARPKHDGA